MLGLLVCLLVFVAYLSLLGILGLRAGLEVIRLMCPLGLLACCLWRACLLGFLAGFVGLLGVPGLLDLLGWLGWLGVAWFAWLVCVARSICLALLLFQLAWLGC